LNEGNQVALLKSGPTRGFDLHWKGPYEFVQWLGPPENRQAQVKNAQGRILNRRAEEIVNYRQESEFLHEVIEPLNPTMQVQDEDPIEVKQDLEDETRAAAPEFRSKRHSEYLCLDKRTIRARDLAEQRELEQIAAFWETGVWTEIRTNPVSIQNPSFFKQEHLR
jgi:hypothetical protein